MKLRVLYETKLAEEIGVGKFLDERVPIVNLLRDFMFEKMLRK